ncbi:MAG: hypothetical protein FXF47_08630 [Candidatus Mcinerneyibacterium aminivorans]|uniref:Uncharacterized protein n=1 Tax=Candidatus Mcinerneyibacterium aminivorans TaxID=2703815 RepID=A0A5D0MGG7_9BACT|nr:MAG: hypothetical protein FXF47_08630 [Candidatus Mcinerneyibacterium aminivorans]
MVNLNIKKSVIPILWLDTFAIIKLTKYKEEKEKLNEVEQNRYEKLNKLLFDKINDEKLLCPKGDQQKEIVLGKRMIDESKESQMYLSLGIRFKIRSQIFRDQQIIFLKAFYEKNKSVKLNFKEAFYNDPIKELKKVNDYIVTINTNRLERQTEEIKNNKLYLKNEFEEIRKKKIEKGISYEEELTKEYEGYSNGYLRKYYNYLEKLLKGENTTINDFFNAEPVLRLLNIWDKYGGNPEGIKGIENFFESKYFKSIPYVDISSKLYSYLMTSRNKIKSGDSMDVDQISAVLPYCNFVFVDKKMAHILKDLEIDKKYNTKVFSTTNFDNFIEALTNL